MTKSLNSEKYDRSSAGTSGSTCDPLAIGSRSGGPFFAAEQGNNLGVSDSPRLCFVGPMVGRNPGRVTTQGQVLSDLFRDAGYAVIAVSASPNRYARLADTIWTLLTQYQNIDTLVVEVYSGPSFLVSDIASRIGRLLGRRVILWLHGGALPEFMGRFPLWASRVLQRAHNLVTPSDYLARAVLVHGFRARLIPNVIDLSAYSYRHRRVVSPRMFWMRAFHPLWNPAMAIRVLDRLRSVGKAASLVMAGEDKGMQEAMKHLASRLNLGDSVRFAGFLDLPGKLREGGNADIYLNTNRVDNTPVAVIEACAMGLPIVTTAVGGIPDLLSEGETGLLVQDDDDKAMAEGVIRLTSDQDLAGRLSANGRRLAERSAWTNVRSEWERLLLRTDKEA